MAEYADRVVTELIADTSGHDVKIRTSAQVVEQSATAIQRSANKAEASIRSSNALISRSFDQTAIRSRLLGYQIADVGAQLAAGTNPFLIVAQQAPQMANAMDGATGAVGRMATFLSGPWGAAMLAAGSVLTILAMKGRDTTESLDDLIRKLEENARKADLARQAQDAYARTLPGVTAAIREETEALASQNRTLAENQQLTLERARGNLASLESQRRENVRAQSEAIRTVRALEGQLRASGGDPRATGPIRGQLEAARAELQRLVQLNAELQSQMAAAQRAIGLAEIPIARRQAEELVDPIAGINAQYDAMARSAERAAQGNRDLAASLTQTLAGIERQRRTALQAEQERQRAERRTTRTPERLYRDFERELRREGITPTSGFRTRQQQAALYARLGPGNAAPPGSSDHEIRRAFDFSANVDRAALARAAERAGVRLGPELVHGRQRHLHQTFTDARGSSGGGGEAQLARVAEEHARNEAAFQDELARLGGDLIEARRRNVESSEEIAAFADEEIEAARLRRNAGYEEAERRGQLTEAQRQQLVAANDATAAEQRRAVQIRLQQQLDEQRYRIAVGDLRDQSQIEQARGQLARTVAERRESELRLLELSHQEELLAIERARTQEGLNDEMRARLDREEAAANERYGTARQVIEQRNMTPLQQYLDQAPSSLEELNEAFEAVATNGLDALNQGIVDAITGAQSLGDVFKNVANQIIADLLRIAVRQAIVSALGSAFGGKGGFSIKGLAGGGSFMVGGFGGIDSNVLSINGRPRARVSSSETVAVIPQGRATGAGAGSAVSGRVPAIINQTFVLDARHGITTPELLQYVNSTARGEAVRAGAAAAKGSLKAAPARMGQFSRDGQ